MNIKNQKGISLVSVLIASALLGGLFLVIAKLMQNSNKVLKTTEVGIEVLDFENLLKSVLQDRDACTRTLGRVISTLPPAASIREGFSPGSGNVLNENGIFNADGNELWSRDDIVIGGLKLKSLVIPENRIDPNNGNSVSNYTSINSSLNYGYLEVYLDVEKTGSSAKGYGGRNKRIKLYLTVEVYDDIGDDHRFRWCQLSGKPIVSTTIPHNCTSHEVLKECSVAGGTSNFSCPDNKIMTGIEVAGGDGSCGRLTNHVVVECCSI